MAHLWLYDQSAPRCIFPNCFYIFGACCDFVGIIYEWRWSIAFLIPSTCLICLWALKLSPFFSISSSFWHPLFNQSFYACLINFLMFFLGLFIFYQVSALIGSYYIHLSHYCICHPFLTRIFHVILKFFRLNRLNCCSEGVPLTFDCLLWVSFSSLRLFSWSFFL